MKTYASKDLRNVAVAGHAHCGKSTLVASLLHTAGMTEQQGRVEDGSAVTAYDEEDVARRTTLQNAVAYAEWNGTKINLIDTPGFHAFAHEVRAAMFPAESVLIVVNALNGVEAVTDRVWKYAEECKMPRMIVLNQMDRTQPADLSGSDALIEGMRERWGRAVVPVQIPIVDELGFHGVVDLVTMESFMYTPDGNGRGKTGEIPAALAAEAKAAHEALVELVAEGKDELMEEFFAVGTIPEEHLISALHEAIREDRIFPVLFTNGLRSIATDHLLDFINVYAPSPLEREPVVLKKSATAAHTNGNGDDAVVRPVSDTEPLTLMVFKSMNDPFSGRISIFKVLSGILKNDATVENYTRKSTERFAHLSVIQGRKTVEVGELHAGDIGAAIKLRDTMTGDTLGPKGGDVLLDLPPTPEPAMTYAIEPKTRADEDKLSVALHKLMEEDNMLRFFRDPQTAEFLIAGTGQVHIEAVVSRLRKRYHTEVTLKSPKVPYRETIRARAEAQGKHKKQSGGHGQYGDCKIRIEPLPRGSGFEFANEIFGGAIPRQYVPAIEKGIQETAARGFLAGYPVVDYKVTVIDGSYHDVDSNELSFKMAGRLAFRKCMEQARPVLLEPVMHVEIDAPEEFAGALMGDLNGRRGRVQGMESVTAGGGAATHIKAEVPLAEMLSYSTTLTSITQGRGSFRMENSHYDVVPQLIADKLIASAKVHTEVEEE